MFQQIFFSLLSGVFLFHGQHFVVVRETILYYPGQYCFMMTKVARIMQ